MALRPRKGKPKKAAPRPPPSPAEELKAALQDLRSTSEQRRRTGKYKGKQRHIDDYRELSLDGTRPADMSQALLEVTSSSYAARKRLLADEPTRVDIKSRRRGPQDPEVEARQAARKLRQEMKRKGIPDQEHYYSAGERLEAGEVDRTYEIERSQQDQS